jgi:hypothetical protein
MKPNLKESNRPPQGPLPARAEQQLKHLGIKLPAPPEPFGTYTEAVNRRVRIGMSRPRALHQRNVKGARCRLFRDTQGQYERAGVIWAANVLAEPGGQHDVGDYRYDLSYSVKKDSVGSLPSCWYADLRGS